MLRLDTIRDADMLRQVAVLLERENDTKTSAVHWLRFELPAAARDAIRRGASVSVGADHPHYRHANRLSTATLESLRNDLD